MGENFNYLFLYIYMGNNVSYIFNLEDLNYSYLYLQGRTFNYSYLFTWEILIIPFYLNGKILIVPIYLHGGNLMISIYIHGKI